MGFPPHDRPDRAVSLDVAFRHSFPGQTFDIAIGAPTPGTIVLFGPSGAGKSTIAAVAAGLLRPSEVRVVVDGTVLADSTARVFVPPERRRVGIVFQDARLFPHLTVAANLRYGLNRSGAGPIGWDEVVDLLGIEHLLHRRPATLSGGEQQRVAIGRALLSQPRLLVMDEPLAGLDGTRRAEILPFLARLRARLALPILYVTHAMDEVSRLADTLAVIEAGRSVAVGPLAQIVADAGLPIAARPDAGAVLACHLAGHLTERGLTRLAVEGGAGLELLVPLLSLLPGTGLRVRIPASEVILASAAPEGISVQNVLAARVVAITVLESLQAVVELRLGEAPFLAQVTPDAVRRLGLSVGSAVLALIKSVSIEVLV
jgi:molybdate transport system ATP-binding protein